MGIQKRVKVTESMPLPVAELDTKPLNENSYALQNLIFDYCGVNAASKRKFQDKNALKKGAD